MHRGLERRQIFKDRYDRAEFLRLLGETVDQYCFVVHAYCLMDNHYHAYAGSRAHRDDLAGTGCGHRRHGLRRRMHGAAPL